MVKASTGVFFGSVLALIAALLLAMSMNFQSFGLTGPANAKTFNIISRHSLWVTGVATYVAAQLVVVWSLTIAPFSLVSALFTGVLLFDDMIAFFIMGRKFTFAEVAGMFIITAAVALVGIFLPKVEYDVNTAWLLQVMQKPSSVITFSILVVLWIMAWMLIRKFERKFPKFPDDRVLVSQSEYTTMRMVYPLMLALVEALGSATLKCLTGLIQNDGFWKDYMFYVCLVLWLTAVFSTLAWLRYVYAKFLTSECLALEIGMANIFSIFLGLFVFQVCAELIFLPSFYFAGLAFIYASLGAAVPC